VYKQQVVVVGEDYVQRNAQLIEMLGAMVKVSYIDDGHLQDEWIECDSGRLVVSPPAVDQSVDTTTSSSDHSAKKLFKLLSSTRIAQLDSTEVDLLFESIGRSRKSNMYIGYN
jgi:hypothetical protein